MDALTRLNSYKNQSFTLQEAEKRGVSAFALAYLTKSGKIKRLAQGLYAFPEYAPTGIHEVIADYLKICPQAIVGLDSALQLYGLNEQLVENITLIVPMSNVPKRKLDDVVFVQVGANYDHIDIQNHTGLPVTTINQTIVDLLRHNRPLSFVLEVFHEAQRKPELGLSISKIKNLAKKFRAKAKTEKFLEAVG